MFEIIRAHQLNIMLGLSSVCGIVGFFALITKSLPLKRRLAIAELEFSAAILLLSDRMAYIYHGDTSSRGYWMVRITNFLVFFMTISVVHSLNIYINDLCGNELGLAGVPLRLKAVELIAGFGWIMVIISQFTGLYYYFDESNVYHRGPGFLICYLIPFIALFIQLSLIFQYIRRLSPYISIPMILFTVAPIIASVIQATNYGVSLTNITIVGMGIVVYIFAILEMNEILEKTRKQQIAEANRMSITMRRSFEQTVAAVANAMDERDRYTRGHSVRTAGYAKQIAAAMGMDDGECFRVYNSVLLHDIGKIEIPDFILGKRERLTDDEYDKLKKHPEIGGDILSAVEELPYLKQAALYHHERYDGKGYPEGLKGDAIPVIGRIAAVADAYDEMTSFKPGREPLAQGRVRQILQEGSGIQYDPAIVNIMVSMIDKDTDYMMRETEDDNLDEAQKNDITKVNRMHFEGYKEQVSDGIRISREYLKIRFETRPDDGFERKKSIPALILFDSYDRCVHRNERSIRNMRYFEFGEIWLDGHTIANTARDIKAEVTHKKPDEEIDGSEWIAYELEAVCIKDHVKLKISSEYISVDVTVALPDSTRYVFFGITGEHCSIKDISVKEIRLSQGDDEIARIAPQVDYFTRKDGDIPNVEVDEYREQYSEGIPVEDGMRLFFHAQSLHIASLVHHCSYIVLYTSDDGSVTGKNYTEFACIRMDGEDATNEGRAENTLTVRKNDGFDGWDAFKELCQRGLDYEVYFSRKKNRISFKTENAGIEIECLTVVPKGTEAVYAALTGDLCTLADIRVR